MPAPLSKLHLVIPGLLGPMANLASAGIRLSVPTLERLLSRADCRPLMGEDYPTTLFALFGLSSSEARDLPEGAVNYLGEGGDVEDACWMRADPVHLRADRDRLLLFNGEQLAITLPEAERIAAQFNQHFAEDNIQLLTPNPARWYLRLDHCPELTTHSHGKVVGRHIEPFMPAGKDARRWRQLNNEMQMLLFQSAVNQQREVEGRVSINGLWLSGVGYLPEVTPVAYRKVYADDPLARGLAKIVDVPTAAVSDDYAAAWEEGEENLLVLTGLVAPVLNVDPVRWAEGMQALEGKLESLINRMPRIKKYPCLHLYPCNGQCYSITPGSWRRFWRRVIKIQGFVG